MDLGLKDKVALVAASSSGLGKAIAWGFAEEGAKVVVCSRMKKHIKNTAKEIASRTDATVLPIVADLSKARDISSLVKEAIETFHRIDILVTNAGGPPVGTFLELSDKQWLQGMDLTLLSAVRLIREVVPYMQKQKWGRIINLTSSSVKQPIDDLVISSALRPGIVGLAKVLANQLAKDNILVNNVCPGHILTKRQEEILHHRAQKKKISVAEYLAEHVKSIPLGRLGEPRELASMVVFLASERASYITGTTIQVDGGLVKGLL